MALKAVIMGVGLLFHMLFGVQVGFSVGFQGLGFRVWGSGFRTDMREPLVVE